MATNEIRLKLVIDGKEAQGVLLNTDDLLDKLRSKSKGIGKGGADDFGAMSQAVGQLGWALGDANMFFVNFRAGMMSVGNNIPMIAQGFLRAGDAAKDAGMSIGKYFMSSLTGPTGIMLGVNAAMFVLQSLPMIFDAINADAKKAAEQGLEDFKKKLEEIQTLSMLKPLWLDIMNEAAILQAAVDSEWFPFIGSEAQEQLKATEAKLELLRKKGNDLRKEATMKLGSIEQQIKDIDIKMKSVTKDDPQADTKIRALANEKIAKQKELDKLTGDTNDKKQKALYISDAELTKQIAQVQQELKKEHSLREQLELRKKLDALNQQAWKLGTSADLAAANDMARGNENPLIGLAGDTIRGNKRLDRVKVPTKPNNPISETTSELQMQLIGMNALEKGWQSLGSTITQSLAAPLRSLQQSNNILENMLGNLLSVGLQMAATGLMGGLFNSLTGGAGGFLSGFMGALGINKMANGGTITEPIIGLGLNTGGKYLMGENGHELVIPKAAAYGGGTLNIRLGGTLTGDGTSLRAVIKRLDKIESAYK